MCLIFCGIAKAQSTLFVNHAALGSNNGSSWSNAFTSLQSALDAAGTGSQIWVAKGVYKPSATYGGNTDRDKTFAILKSLKIYGGFNGTETNINQRNPTENVTILSGDLDNNDLNPDNNFIADSIAEIIGENAYTVVRFYNAGSDLRLDGFTITAGEGAIFDNGGGIFNYASGAGKVSNPVIENCNFRGNYSYSGGAFANHSVVNGVANPTIINCLFYSNFGEFSAGAVHNQSIYEGIANPVFKQCRFVNNRSDFIGGAWHNRSDNGGVSNPQAFNCIFDTNAAIGTGQGGAITNESNKAESSPFFSNCSFLNNTANNGAGFANSGVDEGLSNPIFTGCLFDANEALGNGGAMFNLGGSYNTSSPSFRNCIFQNNTGYEGGALSFQCSYNGTSDPKVINCLFLNNKGSKGGAVFNSNQYQSSTLNPVFINCTFSGNASSGGSEMYNIGAWCLPFVSNCIFWTDSANGKSIQNELGVPQINYTLLKESNCPPGAICGSGMIFNQDPLFLNAQNGDFHLQSESPAIDKGDNIAIPAGITSDLEGNTRIFNGTGLPSAVVDFGAYEFGAPVSAVQDFENTNRTLSIFPIPAASNVNIAYDSKVAEVVNLLVFACSGQLLMHLETSAIVGENIFSLPLTALPTGVYCVQIRPCQKAPVSGVLIKSDD